MKPVTTNKALLLKYSADKEVNIYMPSIKPISDLKNYIDDLKEVDISRRVYLTINGHAEYGILTMEEIDELDRLKAAYYRLVCPTEKKADFDAERILITRKFIFC